MGFPFSKKGERLSPSTPRLSEKLTCEKTFLQWYCFKKMTMHRCFYQKEIGMQVFCIRVWCILVRCSRNHHDNRGVSFERFMICPSLLKSKKVRMFPTCREGCLLVTVVSAFSSCVRIRFMKALDFAIYLSFSVLHPPLRRDKLLCGQILLPTRNLRGVGVLGSRPLLTTLLQQPVALLG